MATKKKMMSIELKREIIKKHEQGVRIVDLARMYGRTTSMICTVLKRKDLVMGIMPAKGVTIISKLRTPLHEEMEKLLMVWMTEKQLQGGILTQSVICEKAREIYDDLLKQIPHTSESFKASRGWFDNFRRRAGIHCREAASSDEKAAKEYIKTFSELIDAKGYIPQQVFNCGETEIFWKRMPNRTDITGEEKKTPGQKPMKNRLTIVLCANASGDCKIKPLVSYPKNPRAYKSHKILKEKLQVMWRENPKAWVTRKLFVEWVNLVFGPSVKKCLQENNLPMQVLLVLDNSSAHSNLEDDLLEEFNFIKVLYLPPNIAPILQPMDQQVISDFKKLYVNHIFQHCFEMTQSTNLREYWKVHYNIVTCLRIIDQAWMGVTTRTLISAWKKLWPDAAVEGLEPELELDERDMNEFVEVQFQELTTEELNNLHSQQVKRKISFEEEPEMKEVISTGDIKEILEMWEKIVKFVHKNHPEKVATGHALKLFNETCLTYFRNILKGRKKQSNRSTGENEQIVTKKRR